MIRNIGVSGSQILGAQILLADRWLEHLTKDTFNSSVKRAISFGINLCVFKPLQFLDISISTQNDESINQNVAGDQAIDRISLSLSFCLELARELNLVFADNPEGS